MNKKITAAVGIIILVLGIWFLVNKNMANAPANTTSPQNTTVNNTPGGAVDQNQNTPSSSDNVPQNNTTAVKLTVTSPQSPVKEFTVTGSNFSFSPATLSVKKGDIVKITFKNSDGFHDFRVDEFNAATKQIKSPAQETITFVANKVGSFEYYCSVGSHRAMGMKGTLTVIE